DSKDRMYEGRNPHRYLGFFILLKQKIIFSIKELCRGYKRYISAFYEDTLRQCPNLCLIFRINYCIKTKKGYTSSKKQ
ncbi:MAG: hypothetical protein ACUVWN_14260, partial [bacterium]